MGNQMFQASELYSQYDKILQIFFAVLVVYYTTSYIYSSYRYSQNLKKAQRRKKLRDSKHFEFEQVAPSKTQKVLNSDVNQLKEMLFNQEVTSVELVHIFGQRCQSIGRKLNLITEEYYQEALEIAKQKDTQLQEAIKQNTYHKLGFLHGIPVSIKDHISEQNKISSVGCTFMADNIQSQDALVVTLLKDQGVIPMVKGNVPQMVFMGHTDNDIYGEALNPHDPTRSCGGSSGGDGGLIAARCAPLAIGTDIGGSIRIPATCNGIFGFKPTSQRMSYQGIFIPVTDGECPQTQIKPAAGPLANSVDDLTITMKSFWQQKHFQQDISVPPLPFNDDNYNKVSNQKQLRIGYFVDFPTFPVSESVKRSMFITRKALEEKGHVLVPFKFTEQDFEDLKKIYFSCTSIAFIKPIIDAMNQNYEKTMYFYKDLFMLQLLPSYFRKPLLQGISLFQSKRLARIGSCFKQHSSDEVDSIFRMKNRFCEKFKQKWDNLSLDAMICPASYHCSFKNEDADILGAVQYYFFIFNILHYPAGVVPITEVKEDEQEGYKDQDNDIFTKKIKNSMKGSKGMPICIQVATPQWRDEECLAVMKIVEQEVKIVRKQYVDQ